VALALEEMPVGLDEALGVTALSITFLHGSIKGLSILSKAKPARYDRAVSSIRLQIELEQHRLFTWAEAAGLTRSEPTLHMSVNDAEFVPKILNELDDLLSDLTRLRKRYPRLDLHRTSDDVESLDDDDATLTKLGPKLREYARRANDAVFIHRKIAWKRLRWATFDGHEAEKLLSEIKGYTARLESFLDSSRTDAWRRERGDDLRGAILNSNDLQTLEIIGCESQQTVSEAELLAVAKLKQIRLKIELSQASSSSPSCPVSNQRVSTLDSTLACRLPPSRRLSGNSLHSTRLHISRLTLPRAATAPDVLRFLTYYDSRIVMLEWKGGHRTDSKALERRVDGIAAFLGRLEPSLHSLPCQGYVKDEKLNRFGYVFNLPNSFQPQLAPEVPVQTRPSTSTLPNLRTLRGLFDQSSAIPSLDRRFTIAAKLLETLLNLHTSGWLHKQFCSENIVFVRANSAAEGNEIDILNYSMYIAGYGYARPDEPGEMTEPFTIGSEADLYRHPTSLGPQRTPFRRSFDIFSVGCTLLEIGLWSSLQQILFQHASPAPQSNIGGSPRYRTFQASSITRTTSSSILDSLKGEEESLKMRPRRRSSMDPSRDLMKLRHDLLLSRLQHFEEPGHSSSSLENGSTQRTRCKILQSLAAATGNAYTGIVERLLSGESTGTNGSDTGDEEKENALVLEIDAVNKIQAIKKAIE
jgi:Prion-inhibition and propagation